MFLVKKCPECGKLIRFPVDKGRVRVSCPCGYSFIADPDDKEIYKDSFFDRESLRENSFFDKIRDGLDKRKTGDYKKDLINNFLEAKYWIQNFHLLPASEKMKFLVPAVLILLAIIAIIMVF